MNALPFARSEADTRLASVPPMGWNSWDSYGTTVTEGEVVANAEFIRDHLLQAGWNTVVVDIAWYDPDARAHGYNDRPQTTLDEWGRQLPAPGRFPSAADGDGFTPLVDAVHTMGLRFGLHVMRGIPRLAVERDLPVLGTSWTAAEIADREHVCTWNSDNFGLDHTHPGAQAYYDSQVAQFAQWGVDFIKADDMLAPYHSAEIEAYSRAIERSGRPIVLSLSPGTKLSTRHRPHLAKHAQMWRISDDLWDRWGDIHAQFARLARWAPLQSAGGWADADMLPLGRIGLRAERGEPRSSLLTADEQKTMLTLWAMARSPLMVGGDLPTSDAETIALLANPALQRVLGDARDSAEIVREPADGGELIVWAARSAASDGHYVALFWTGDGERDVVVPVASVVGAGIAGQTDCAVLLDGAGWRVDDLWNAGAGIRQLPTDGSIAATVPSHGAVWFALEPARPTNG